MVNPTDIASWERRRRMVNPRDIDGNTEDACPEILLGTQKKYGEPQRYSWERRRSLVKNTAGNTEVWPEIQLGTEKEKSYGESRV